MPCFLGLTVFLVFRFFSPFVFHSLTIELEVRTEAESGLLFYMARINHADFATVQLRNGFPYFSYDLGSGNTSTMIPTRINDGQWHKVTVPGCGGCSRKGPGDSLDLSQLGLFCQGRP